MSPYLRKIKLGAPTIPTYLARQLSGSNSGFKCTDYKQGVCGVRHILLRTISDRIAYLLASYNLLRAETSGGIEARPTLLSSGSRKRSQLFSRTLTGSRSLAHNSYVACPMGLSICSSAFRRICDVFVECYRCLLRISFGEHCQ